MREVIVHDGQSLLDICIQEYGSVDALIQLAKDNALSLDHTPTAGDVLSVDESITFDTQVKNYFTDKNLIINTWSPNKQPAAPSDLLITLVEDKLIDVSLTSNSYGSESGFEFQLSEDSLFTTLIETKAVVSTICQFENLTPDTTYYIRARALTYGEYPSDWTDFLETKTILAFSFHTNMDSAGTFDPAITYSGSDTAKWVFENGTELLGSSINTLGSEVGFNGSTQSIKLFLADFSLVTAIRMPNDFLVGDFDLTLFAGNNFSNLTLSSNNLTSVTGLSALNFVSSSSVLNLSSNESLNEPMPTSISGTFLVLNLSRCNYTGTIDLSAYDYASNADILLNHNDLTSITHPVMNSGSIRRYRINENNLSGVQDFSGIIGSTTSFQLALNGNEEITDFSDIKNPDTAQFLILWFNNCDITGIKDFSSYHFSNYASGGISANHNPNLTGLILSKYSGPQRLLRIHRTSIHNFDILSIGNGSLDVDDSSFTTHSCDLTAAEVNKYLVDCVSIYNPGFTGRTIRIGGSNEDPDATSGGYDGLAAIATLNSYGITVS